MLIVWIQNVYSYPPIEENIIFKLNEEFKDEEIKQAIFDIAPCKSTRLDGYPAG